MQAFNQKMERKNKLPLLLSLVSIVVSVIVLFLYLRGGDKIVYVDSAKLLDGYKGMQEARKKYESRTKMWQSNVDTLTQDVQKAIMQYEKDAARGSDKEKELSKQLINTKQKSLADYQNAVRQNASQEESKLNADVFTTVNNYLSEYGKSHHYRFILLTSNGNLGYADKSTDITEEVLSGLNSEYKSEAK